MKEIAVYRLIIFYARNWLVILALTTLALIGGLIYNNFIQTPLYRSEATLIFISSSQQSATQDVTQLNNYVKLFQSRRVLEPVIESQNINMSYDQFVSSVSAVNNKGTEVISLSVSTDNAEKSRKFLEEAVYSFKKESKALYGSDNLTLLDNASLAATPYNVHALTQLAIAGAAGLIVSFIVLFFIYDINGDTTVAKKKTKKDKSKKVTARKPLVKQPSKNTSKNIAKKKPKVTKNTSK